MEFEEELILGPVSRIIDRLAVISITFPTATRILDLIAHGDGTITNRLINTQGTEGGSPFTAETLLQPGDYLISVYFSEPIQRLNGIGLRIAHEPISPFVLSQLIFGIYRILGHEPGHVLRLPVKSPTAPTSRKTSSKKVEEELKDVRDKLGQLIDMNYSQEKGAVGVEEIEKLVMDRDRYLRKLTEAEDYIDRLLQQRHRQ